MYSKSIINRIIVLGVLISFLSIGCSKEEPLPEREPFSKFISPNVGGPNQPNQVFVNLSANDFKTAKRDSWDLGFYSGDDFRVGINASTYMAVKKLETNNIDAVKLSDVSALYSQVAIGTFDPTNINYVDNLDGDIKKTAMDEVSSLDANNNVYLLNLGYNVSTTVPNIGSVSITGTHRGWKKIRILRRFDDYVLQYANIEDTTHKEVVISKNPLYNFTFFSFNTESEASVEPKKNNWDMCFTVYINEIPNYGTYGYTDFITTNSKMAVKSYKVTEATAVPFTDFTLAMVDETLFSSSQRKIGSSWRSGGGPGVSPGVFNNVFYVIKDTEGIYYKVKFTALTNTLGERGNPQFQYEFLK